MRFVGYGDYDWEADGFWYVLPNPFVGTVSIEPMVIPRPGTSATFGMSTIGAATFPGKFGYSGTAMTIEAAFLSLLTRLNPLDQTARQLRAMDENGVIIWVPAKIRVPAQSEDDEVNTYEAHFISVDPFWTPLTAATISGTF